MASPAACTVHQQGGGPLVVSVAIGYSLADHRRFVLSLRAHYQGALTLLTGDKLIPNATATLCCAHRARLDSGTAHGLNTSRIVGVFADGRVHGVSRSHAAIFSRHVAYARLCSRGLHSLCLGVDFRDVFFQGNPFAWGRYAHSHRSRAAADGGGSNAMTGSPDLVLAVELNSTHGSSLINRNWVRTCFDDPTADLMVNTAVLNSGTVLGTAAGLQALSDVFGANMHLASRVRRGRGFLHAVQCNDQAVLNYAVHTRAGGLRGMKIEMQRHGDSFAASLYAFKRKPSLLRLSSDGLVLSDGGTPTPLVHQFDRLSNVRFGALQGI